MKILAQQRASSHVSAKNFARQAQKRRIWGVVSEQGKLFRARTHIRSSRANFFALRTPAHGDFETNDTSAATGSGQHETTITNARPQTATIETGNTTAAEKRTKNAHFAPAKAMAVSVEARPAPAKATTVSLRHRYRRAKATTVSDKLAAWPTGPGCGAHGQQRHRLPNFARNLSWSFF